MAGIVNTDTASGNCHAFACKAVDDRPSLASIQECRSVALTPEDRARLLASTRAAAIALIEDLEHLRMVVSAAAASQPSTGDLRRMSAVLRRLLVDRDLPRIAAPRIGKIRLKAPDNSTAYRADRVSPLAFFASGGATTAGIWMRAAYLLNAPNDVMSKGQASFDNLVALPPDNFLDQRVVALNGEWVNRRDIIKFVANTASGVHSGAPETNEEKLIARMRHILKYDNGGLRFDMAPLRRASDSYVLQPGDVDVALVELLCMATFLIESADVSRLVGIIQSELAT
jgi:hypothetical protein